MEYKEITPIDQAIVYLQDLDLMDYFELAHIGVYLQNPYHNLNHELLVVYHAMTAFYHAYGGLANIVNGRESASELAIAALFHDHDHSGGKTTDDKNINRALARITSLHTQQGLALPEDVKTRIRYMIRKTMFMDGTFPNEPDRLREECLRDADLCMIYTSQGRKLLMELPRELDGGHSLYHRNVSARLEFYANSRKFLESCQMYTEYGQMMKDFHLDRACQDFERAVEYLADHPYSGVHSLGGVALL
jgi:hypothetical protein